MKRSITQVVSWGQELLAEVVKPGDLCVDLTAGNGKDTRALYAMTGPRGQVVAFDIQRQALKKTNEYLMDAGADVRFVEGPAAVLERRPGIDLVCDSHESLNLYLPEAPVAVIANLGYLPGGDTSVITRSASTLSALSRAAECLIEGGRMSIVAYPGHPGGDEEAVAVADFFSDLPDRLFQVLLVDVANRPHAPVLHVAEKRMQTRSELPLGEGL